MNEWDWMDKFRKNEEEIEKTKSEIERIEAEIEENRKKLKDVNKQMFKTKLRIFYIDAKFYLGTLVQIPVFILLMLFVVLMLFFDNNIRAMALNIYHDRYTKEELNVIFGFCNRVIVHSTYIFYIILLAAYVFIK